MVGLSLDLLTSTRALARLLALGLALAGSTTPALAQLSPGPLSRAHADLEGVRQCTSCHGTSRRDVRAGCLSCHQSLAARIDAQRGLHAGEDHAACETCHHEHLGREFALVSWPDAGLADFDHSLVDYPLLGRHATLACRACHQPQQLESPDRLRSGGVSLERTYLGLPTTCVGCHPDPHRDQLGSECVRCHDQQSWSIAASYDHSQTAFPLTGAHVAVPCAKCHPPLAGAAATPGARCYRGVAHGACIDCHRDPHGGRLGADCVRCHETTGWSSGARDGFDHDRTAFPLLGRHALVACVACHGASTRGRPLPHEACADCHRDVHGARAGGEIRWLRCEECHDVAGFRPARFTLADHDSTGFSLRGAHRALPCMSCHRTATGETAAGAVLPLDLAHAACTDCHANPHGPLLARVAGGDDCRTCHREESWRNVAFAHERTGWPLGGRHADIACRACHAPTAPATVPSELAFAGASRTCAGCHADPHRGQFADEATPAAPGVCDRCHAPDAWRPAHLDHDQETRFPLTGAHRRVACVSCHPLERDAAGEFARYRPRGTQCVDCHGVQVPSPAAEEEG